MYWKLMCEHAPDDAQDTAPTHGRFVVHRHHDALGPHLDLRLELEGCLAGFRIDAAALEGECWATEKAPHPLTWLDRDGDAVREDSGTYVRETFGEDELRIVLRGRRGTRVLRAVREQRLGPKAAGDICAALDEHGQDASQAAQLISDGIAARRRAIGRLCGLARELDGAAFDEDVCRRSAEHLTLDEIHAQLRPYENRFDAKYPPAPVSRPSVLPDASGKNARPDALAILRE